MRNQIVVDGTKHELKDCSCGEHALVWPDVCGKCVVGCHRCDVSPEVVMDVADLEVAIETWNAWGK